MGLFSRRRATRPPISEEDVRDLARATAWLEVQQADAREMLDMVREDPGTDHTDPDLLRDMADISLDRGYHGLAFELFLAALEQAGSRYADGTLSPADRHDEDMVICAGLVSALSSSLIEHPRLRPDDELRRADESCRRIEGICAAAGADPAPYAYAREALAKLYRPDPDAPTA